MKCNLRTLSLSVVSTVNAVHPTMALIFSFILAFCVCSSIFSTWCFTQAMKRNKTSYMWTPVVEWSKCFRVFLGGSCRCVTSECWLRNLSLATKKVNQACTAGRARYMCVYTEDGKFQCSLLGFSFYALLLQVLICSGFRRTNVKSDPLLKRSLQALYPF